MLYIFKNYSHLVGVPLQKLSNNFLLYQTRFCHFLAFITIQFLAANYNSIYFKQIEFGYPITIQNVKKKLSGRSQDAWLRLCYSIPPLQDFFWKFHILHFCQMWYPIIKQNFLKVSTVLIFQLSEQVVFGTKVGSKNPFAKRLFLKIPYVSFTVPYYLLKLSNKLSSRSQTTQQRCSGPNWGKAALLVKTTFLKIQYASSQPDHSIIPS